MFISVREREVIAKTIKDFEKGLFDPPKNPIADIIAYHAQWNKCYYSCRSLC